MRQVNEDELVWRVKYALSRVSTTTRRGLASSDREARKQAEQLLAIAIVRECFRTYEVLSDGPLPRTSDLYSAAAFGTGCGSAPTIAPEE